MSPSRSQPPPPGPPPVLERSGSAPGRAADRPAVGTFDVGVTPAAALAAGLAWEGSLAEASALHLCYLAAAVQANGRLRLAAPDAELALVYRRGGVEHVTSTDPADDLGAFLVRRGAVRREAVDAARSGPAGAAADLVGALLAARWLDPATCLPLLQEHGVAVLARALSLGEGAARFEPGVAPPASAFSLGPRWAVLCAAARRLDGAATRRLLGDRLHRVAARSGGRVELQALPLTAQEARAAGLFDGRSSPAELAARHPAESEGVVRLALLLGESELLRFGEARPPPPGFRSEPPRTSGPRAGPATAPSSPPPPRAGAAGASGQPAAATPRGPATPAGSVAPAGAAPHGPATHAGPSPRGAPAPRAGSASPGAHPVSAAPAGGAAPPASAAPGGAPRPGGGGSPGARPTGHAPVAAPRPAESAADLKALLERLASADHFGVLGVSPETPAAQVKAAYFKLAKRYHPDAAAPGEPAEARQLRAEIFARVGEAWGVLGDDRKRAAYLARQKAGAAEVDVMGIVQAENLFQMAVALVRTRKYEEAGAKLEEAIALNAGEPEFQVWKAWVDFLRAPDKRRQREASAATIEAALRTAPRCMAGYLFLGQMAKLTGDAVAAERCYKRGLALDPDQTDLQRELKYLRK